MKFGEMPPMYVPPRPSGIEPRGWDYDEPPESEFCAECGILLEGWEPSLGVDGPQICDGCLTCMQETDDPELDAYDLDTASPSSSTSPTTDGPPQPKEAE